MKYLTLPLVIFVFSGCMKTMVDGLGFGDLNDRQQCPDSVIESYRHDKLQINSQNLKQDYENMFNCKLDGV